MGLSGTLLFFFFGLWHKSHAQICHDEKIVIILNQIEYNPKLDS